MGKTIPALVTPEVLTWARNLDCITIDETAARIKVKREKVQSWENGSAYPTLRQAKELSKFYRVPFVYLYLPDTPKKTKRLEKADFRTFGNNGAQVDMSRELRWLLRDIEDRRDALLELYSLENRKPVPFSFYASGATSEKDIADQIRSFLGLTSEIQNRFRKAENALAYCIRQLESRDVLVFQAAKIDPREMRGLSIGYDEIPIIVLNRKDEYSARLFTLIHELTHIIIKNTGICNAVSTNDLKAKGIELFCNQVAGLTLVPDNDLYKHKGIQKILTSGLDDVYVSAIARDFAVSKEVIIYRLCAIGVITKEKYSDTLQRYIIEYKRYAQKKKPNRIPPAIDIGSQVGRLYTRTVLSAFHNDRITARDASGYLLNLGTKHFSKVERWCLK